MYKLHKKYTNVNWIIYAAADMLFVYKTYTFFTFPIFASVTMSSSILFCNFLKFQDQSFYTQKDSQMNLYYRFTSY